jgi:hypothetical protein
MMEMVIAFDCHPDLRLVTAPPALNGAVPAKMVVVLIFLL